MYKQLAIIFLASILLGCKGKAEEITITKEEVNYYSNPILQGFYPDPSICKVGGNFYMVNSTFAYFPGIPIFESPDLVNWKQIGNVLDRPEQLDLDGLGVSEGIFAPAINFHNGTFYLACTVVGKKGNFIMTSKKPKGPWSNPVWVPEVLGIDPSLFFDDNGSAYIIYNSEAPENKPEYDGHRTIKMYELEIETLKVKGNPIILIDKGSKPKDKPIWIEGPHIYKKNDFYYLMAAEGGTSEQHSEVIFRSKNINGPYESFKNNPILTQRHLNENRKHPITSTGHADIIEDNQGNWWGVFLGCRPYDNQNHFNTGRETFMAPVKWENEWPIFDLGGGVVKPKYPTPNNVVKEKASFKYAGEYEFIEAFNNSKLGNEWLFLRTPKEQWYSILDKGIHINTRSQSASNNVNPSFIGYRQQHIKGSVSTQMYFSTTIKNEKSGLIAFQNESHYYYLCKSYKSGKPVVQLFKSNNSGIEEIVSKELTNNSPIQLKIVSKGLFYEFLYNEGNGYKVLIKNVDATFLSTKQAAGFVGTIYAMYTTSLGETSSNKAIFNWFQIENKDK